MAQARLGELVLDKWRLTSLLGIGGMAAVFEAVHRNGSRVAIKFLHEDLADSGEIRERFLTEGYAANRVAHPGVVTVRDEGTTADGAVFLVMDLLSGQTLADRLDEADGPLSVGETLDIASQLLDVLAQAHSRGIVHRDIKPDNVFLTREGRVRLLDFGIARVEAAARTYATKAGSTLGTPAFMPPEQALGHWEELDGRSDLWSLGATLYLMLSAVPVREPGSETEQLLRAMTRRVPSLGEVADLPRCVVAVVDRALAFNRDDRFPDARSMQLAVRAVQDELRAPSSHGAAPPPSTEPVAVSLRTPRASGDKRPSVPTMRPVATTSQTESTFGRAEVGPAPSALPFFVSLGFAVGISIVVAARLGVQSQSPRAAEQPVLTELAPPRVAEPLPPPAPSLSAATSASARLSSSAVPSVSPIVPSH